MGRYDETEFRWLLPVFMRSDAFDDAMEGSAGLDLVPQATLGSQVVAGTNYRYLCAGQPVVQDPSTSLYIVDVYSDLDGKSQISDVKYFDLLSYINQ